MRDDSDQKDESLQVRTDRIDGPYIIVAAPQVPQVRVLLDSFGLSYSITGELIGTDDESATVITFGSDANADQIQRLLDGIN